MASAIMGMFAETNLHPGTGQVSGVVDLPVAREKTTDYPVIVGSSLKGALKDTVEQHNITNNSEIDMEQVFGSQKHAGCVAVSDGRLLLLPVRSLNSHYKWVTCPYLLERYQRDCALAGVSVGTIDITAITDLKEGEAIATGKGRLYLEDAHFEIIESGSGTVPFAEAIKPMIRHSTIKERLAENLVVVSNDEFSYFARYSLSVNARNLLDKQKISQNLWYEETVPTDTLFYALFAARPGGKDHLNALTDFFDQYPYLQIGGNETIGQGWTAITFIYGGVSD
ncbi:MAG: type III-B CRISPR module RAMP protein Cmr4 [Firmicutes bacterium]|jgi:CRISPR-associated protein Cmr4|nr:type III-B CRISPR module RAMP protein Cmr4 [Bacillota bacterium]